MLFRQFFDHESYTYTYLLAQEHEAILIDPVVAKTDYYLTIIQELSLKLALVIDTHVHADHVTASGKLRQASNCLIGMSEFAQVQHLDIRFKDQAKVPCPGIEMSVLLTPGHTDDSLCLVMHDRVFTGDTLFIRGTGRTDFQNGSACEQYRSITERLLTLDEATLVYPGHDYNGATVSTIGEEKRFNPRICGKTREEYIGIMNNLNLAKPKLIDTAVPKNRLVGLNN